MDLTHFDITHAEREAGSLAPSKLAQLRDSFETNGYAVVSGLISAEIKDVSHLITQADRLPPLKGLIFGRNQE